MKLLIIDKIEISNDLFNKKYTILYWNNNLKTDHEKAFSIINIIEENADFYKSVYLKWINNIGELKIKNTPLYKIKNKKYL